MSQEKQPAVNPKVSRAIAGFFAFIIVGGFGAALTMLIAWGLVSLYNLLFG